MAAATNANAEDREIDLQEFLATHQFRNPMEIAARSRMSYNRDRMQTMNLASQPSTSASNLDSITLFTPEAAPPVEAPPPPPPRTMRRPSIQFLNPFRTHERDESDEEEGGRLSPIALEGLQAS